MGYWARELPKQDLRFPTGWEEIREGQKTLALLFSLSLTSQPNKPQSSFSPQYLSSNPWKGWRYQQGSLGPNSNTCAHAGAVPCAAGLPEIRRR